MSWPMVKLGDVCTITMGQAPKGDTYNDEGNGIALIAGAGDFGLSTPQPKKYTTAANKLSQVGDLILCIRATIGDLNWSDEEYCLGRGVAGLRPNLELDKNYLWYFITANKQELAAKGTGSTFKQVSRSIVEDWQIPLPPLEEQKRIAAILDKADAIRQKRKQAIALADEFLRSVFLEMFGDPVTNPKGWEVKPLGSMILKGPTNGLYKPSSSYGSGCRILRIDGFYDGELVGEDKLKRVELSEDELVKYLLPARSVVINRVNSPEYLGKCAFVENLSESTVFESNMMNFIVDENLINPRFLVMQLQMPNIKKQIQTRAKHAVNQSSINQQDVKGFDLLVPPIELQNKYESIVEALKKNRNALIDHQDKSFGLFSSLSQKAFSGQL
ncbi:restriction endonuclease subunit S [Vibrio vulnificus]|nr:restriction endonuclease subunit S [Vibrio vulnificus]HAS8376292.1 restriction endonuclease subunit S [Vibrio vulnificus]